MAKDIKKIEFGDMANFDFAGFLGEEQFEGGTAKGYQMVIGSGQFIPGFEQQMVGMAVGETKDIEVQFPFNYHADWLAGEEVVFKVKINGIKKARR